MHGGIRAAVVLMTAHDDWRDLPTAAAIPRRRC
jgi:hypothetical protein